MAAPVLILFFITCGISLWLGFYGILLGLDFLHSHAPTESSAETLARLGLPMLLFPAWFWANAMIALLPEGSPTKNLGAVKPVPIWLLLFGLYFLAATKTLL